MSKSRPLRDYSDDADNYTNNHDAFAEGESAEYSAEYSSQYSAEYSQYGPAADGYAGYSGDYSAAYPAADDMNDSRALVATPAEGANLPSEQLAGETGPVVIPGTGLSMGNPFIKRRERPLTMRIAILTITACVIVTGLFAATPLTGSATGAVSSFEALSGVVVWHKQPGFFWYTAQAGDTPEGLAQRFNVQVGGIYEMNGLDSGQELAIGKSYKIPEDPSYGAGYRPPQVYTGGGAYGQTTFGNEWYNSFAGAPGPEAICGVDGHGSYLGYDFVGPNPGSSWVRGFSWYHDGVDIAAPQGNPIHAAQAGQVIWAGFDATNGFGWSVKINHCYHVSTLYGHMMRIIVKDGENVEAGQIIGYEGSTGWSTGPHLHISVMWNNVTINPMLFYSSVYAITH